MSHGFSLVLPIVAAASAMVYLPLSGRAPSVIRSAVKTVPLVALSLFAAQTHFPAALVAALALSALGDLALSRAGERAFLVGLASFALAHIAYALAFFALEPFVPHWPALVGLLIFAASAEIWLIPFADAMKWPVRVYIILICAMVWAAIAVGGMVALGAALFMASDLILSLRLFRFRATSVLADHAVWALYIAAQMLIVFAFLGLRN